MAAILIKHLIFFWTWRNNIHGVVSHYNKLFETFFFSKGDIRLVDGDAPNQGRIEIYSNSTWWKLCSSGFYGQAFETVCRQLNRPLPSQKFSNSDFGAGNLTYLSTTFYCDTTKSSLLNCWQPWQYGHCGAENSVGVVCGDMVYAGKLDQRKRNMRKLKFLLLLLLLFFIYRAVNNTNCT